jgi:hypothetical protein
MPLGKKDHMGRRGESIAFVHLTEVCRPNGLPYFTPHFLGDKSPLFDAFVELVVEGDDASYFFAQIKSTRLGYNSKKPCKSRCPKAMS